MNNSLSIRINVIITSVVTVVLLSFGIYDHNLKHQQRYNALREHLDILSTRFAKSVAHSLWDVDMDGVKSTLISEMNQKEVYAIYVYETTHLSTVTKPIAGICRDENWKPELTLEQPGLSQEQYFARKKVVRQHIDLGHIELCLSDKFIRIQEENEISRGLGILSIVIFTLVVALIIVLKTQIILPITIITREFKKVEAGNFDLDYDPMRTDELGMMCESFSFMRREIKMKIDDLESAKNEAVLLRRYLSNIIDSMPSVLIGIDLEGCVTQWNLLAEKNTGISKESAVGRLEDC